MRLFPFILLFGICAILVINVANAKSVSEKHAIAKINQNRNKVAATRNWLADLIEAILGMTVVQLLDLVYTNLIGADILLKEAVSALENILSLVTPEVQTAIEQIMSDALTSVFELMQPILDQLGLVIPVISKDTQSKDLITDLIEAMLGIPFDELMTSITEAFFGLDILVEETMIELHEIASNVDGEVGEMIENISKDTLEGAQELVTPVLEKLQQLFPQLQQMHIPNKGKA